jgi:methionyl-tRNA synthetase
MSTYYITTPIYYVNDAPHLGHAYATIASDALARFHRAQGKDSYFLTGTDEHGQKIEQAASKKGKAPQELADEVVGRYQATWKHLHIANSDFIRTTDHRHKLVVTEMWKRMAARGDIYLGSYDGYYCVDCEAFYPESQLIEGKRCPTHEREVEWLSEASYFFRMSNYQDALLEHFAKHPDFVRPENYRNEVLSFIKSGLRDLSVSRTTFRWGIPVPGDPAHVIYVWIDALTNYISALGGPGAELYDTYWPADCHLIGKDILRFHAVYWPCMLLSAGLPLPKTVFVTGWWTLHGAKISKSMPATYVEPNRLAEDLGADALRYFLLREVPLGLDGDFSYEALIGRYNAELANDLGNLLNRTLTMAGKFCGGKVPAASVEHAGAAHHGELVDVARKSIADSAHHFAEYAPSRALEAIWTLVRETNRYVDTCQPWKLAKDADKRAELDHCMRMALEALLCVARLVWPVMPGKAAELAAQLGVSAGQASVMIGTWPTPERFGQELEQGADIEHGQVLFPRIDKDRQAALLEAWMPPQVIEQAQAQAQTQAEKQAQADKDKASAAGEDALERIPFAHFGKLDLRVGEIKEAELVPKANKLLRLRVDLGEAEPRQIVAGIAGAFQPDVLIGRKVIVVANLEPATIRGVESQGMILAAGEKDILGLSTIDADVPVGTRVR